LLKEYATILGSIVDSAKLCTEVKQDEAMFARYFQAKKKKMNMEMMVLCDCITTKPVQTNLSNYYFYIKCLSEICESRAIALKDLHDSKNRLTQNNLYHVWSQLNPMGAHAEYLRWIHDFCDRKFDEYQIRESVHFDQRQYDLIMLTLESYYSEVPIKMLTSNKL